MELALLVWGVDLLSKLGGFLGFTLTLFSVVVVIAFIITGFSACDNHDVTPYWKKYFPTKTLVVVLFFVWIIPSQQTMKYIAAGYLIQETFLVQESITLSQKAVINQLQSWAEDDTEIKSLLESADIPVPKLITEKEIPNEE
jgi:hypothetical protein